MSGWPPPPARLHLEDGEVHVWHHDLEEDPKVQRQLRKLLEGREKERADRFVIPRPRKQFIAGRALVRRLLGRYLGRKPEDLRFDYGQDGKPALRDDDSDLRFNLSHSGGTALLAVTRSRELGVDVERVRDDVDHLAVSERWPKSS